MINFTKFISSNKHIFASDADINFTFLRQTESQKLQITPLGVKTNEQNTQYQYKKGWEKTSWKVDT